MCVKINKIILPIFLVFPLMMQGQTGGFGYAIVGGNFASNYKLQEKLRAPTLLGNSSYLKPGLHFGGRGFGVFGRYLLGVTVWSNFSKINTDSAQVMLVNNAGFLNAGYLLLKREKTNIYFFSGIGATISSLEIINMGKATMQFPGDDRPIQSGQARLIPNAGFGGEIGFGITQMIVPGEDETSKGGVMMGMVAGVYYFINDNGSFYPSVNSIGPLSGLYVGITIGGGIQMKNNARLFQLAGL